MFAVLLVVILGVYSLVIFGLPDVFFLMFVGGFLDGGLRSYY